MEVFRIIKKFFSPVFKNKYLTLRALIPSVSLSFISVLLVYFLKEIINLYQKGDYENIPMYVSFFVGFGIYNMIILVVGRNWGHGILWPNYRKVLYEEYVPEFIRFDNNEVEKIGTGKFIAIIDKGLNSWVDFLVRIILEIFPGCIVIIFSFILIYIMSVFYFFITLGVFLLIFFLTILLQKQAKELRNKRRDANILILSRFVKILMSKFEIFQNNKALDETKKVTSLLQENIRINKIIGNYNVVTDFLIRFIIDGAKIFLILSLVFGFLGQKIDIGEFISLTTILYMFDSILNRFFLNYVDFTKISPDIEKLWDTYNSIPRIQDNLVTSPFQYKKGNIELKNLTYSYEGNNNVFENFSLEIQGGKITAFVGPSGGGKSTLVKLIAGYLRANAGEIEIDGQKLSETSLKSYYQNIGYLTQEPSVFDGTIRENLMYALDNVGGSLVDIQINQKGQEQNSEKGKTQNQKKGQAQDLPLLENILKLSRCEFIYDLPKGLETEIGERGIKLSGGQKQRLAIAKIFLKNPKIIILDEPTSALDSQSEKSITQAMHELFKDRTVLVIAHRLQTVKYADEIIVIDQGKILERGNHESLITKKGYYAEMLELQSGF